MEKKNHLLGLGLSTAVGALIGLIIGKLGLKIQEKIISKRVILSADVGSTNCVLELQTKSGQVLCSKTYCSQDYPSFESIIVKFLWENQQYKPKAAIIRCEGDEVKKEFKPKGCNHWNFFTIEQFKKITKIPKIIILQDADLRLLGYLVHKKEEVLPIYNSIQSFAKETLVIFNIDNEVQVNVLRYIKTNGKARDSYCTHAYFWNNEQREICQFFLDNLQLEYLTAEQVICGQMFHLYYEFQSLQFEFKDWQIETYNNSLDVQARNDIILESAKQGNKAALEGIKLYMQNLGIIISNIALQELSYGGIYLSGQLVQNLYSNGFFEGEFKEVLIQSMERRLEIITVIKDIPVVIVKIKNLEQQGLKLFLIKGIFQHLNLKQLQYQLSNLQILENSQTLYSLKKNQVGNNLDRTKEFIRLFIDFKVYATYGLIQIILQIIVFCIYSYLKALNYEFAAITRAQNPMIYILFSYQ